MGSPVAPSVANVYMASVEDNFIINSKYRAHVECWYRYVDDIFMLWSGTENQLEEFMSHINSIHSLLEFTLTKDTQEICFLNVKVIKEVDTFRTTLYSKPTVSMPPRYLIESRKVNL